MRLPTALRVAIAALAAALVLAPAAGADRRWVRDAKRETAPLRKHGRLDIIKAKAAHRGELLVHTVVMRKRVNPKRGKERPLVAINVRGGRRSDPEYLVFGGALFKERKRGEPKRVGDATLTSRGRRWIYRFDPTQIPKLKRYGWAAITSKGNTFDVAPAKRYKQHRL